MIGLLDSWDTDLLTKKNYLNQLKFNWVQQQVHDNQLSWYSSTGNEKQKCKIAWLWYQENHPMISMHATEFSKAEDLFGFLDSTAFSQEAKLHHMAQIKKKCKAQQTQANREGKKQTNVSLSDSTRLQLDELARKERRTKTEIIELLIENAHANGMPH